MIILKYYLFYVTGSQSLVFHTFYTFCNLTRKKIALSFEHYIL